MKVVILHLSDIHIKNEFDQILNQDLKIAKAIYSHIDEGSRVVILVSGDIAYSGGRDQFGLAEVFFRKIESHIKRERKIEVDFVLCPGNHDCDFSKNPTREFILKNVLESDIKSIDPSILLGCTGHQDEYFKFRERITGENPDGDRLWSSKEVEIAGRKFVFESVNLSWSSALKEQQGKIQFPFSAYSKKASSNADIRVAIMHHPLNWLNQTSYREFRGGLRSVSNFIFTGHEHNLNAINHDDVESGETIIIEGGVLQEDTLVGSAFGVVVLDLQGRTTNYFSYEFLPEKEIYIQKEKKELISFSHDVKKYFGFNSSFVERIEDCGAYFKNSNSSNIKLEDIFVYPNLKGEGVSKAKSNIVSSKILLNLDNFSKGVVLSADDNAGSTSLIYTLIREYANNGYLPLLLKGSDIKTKHETNLNLQIDRALSDQYEDADFKTIWDQEPISKKILFIDDFDETKIRSESSKREILSYLMNKFERVIITVDSMFEVGELTSLEGASISCSFDHYKIEPFGYKNRTELINKWYSLGQQDSESEAEIIGKCNIAEKLMDTVMDKSLISPLPIFFLTFLQSIEADQSTQLIDSALGHYYKYLLTQSFLDVGIGADSLGQELDYAMKLAYFFNEKDSFSITLEEFKSFNEYFSNTWQEISFERQEKTLLNAKVLIKSGDDYEFRYSYNYYYLLGGYLSENILDENIQLKISQYIEHLYVKKNANTILFLAHHSTSDNILLMMKNAADGLFKDNVAADFNGNCSVAHDLIRFAPKLEYNKKSPQENRSSISENRDSFERDAEQERTLKADRQQDVNNIDLASKLTMLFKTIEILSQIIKSNPTKFERSKKVEIIKSIFLAPLRALQDFYNFLEVHPAALIQVINNAIAQKTTELSNEEREKIARLAVSRIIQGLSSSFIIKTGQIVNSSVLKPDITTVISKNSTLAFELIELAILLDSHKPLPRNKISDFYSKCENNSISQKSLDLIIMNRLHLYKTNERDMQWLQSELKYDLKRQHQIGYDKSSKIQ